MRTLSQKLEGAKRYVKHPDYKIGLKMLDEFIEDAKKLEAQVKNLTLHSVKHRICANCGWMDYLKWSDGKPICTCGMFYISDINTFSCNAFMTKDEYEKEFGV